MYNNLKKELAELLSGERNFIANASNMASLIYHEMESLNWVGFYFLEGNELVLGPFQGKPACIRIKIGRGVCGTSFKERKTIIVPNVHEFPGHIACDSASNSEIVIPMIFNDKLFGVFDMDSPKFERFEEEDKKALEEMTEMLINGSDIEKFVGYYNN